MVQSNNSQAQLSKTVRQTRSAANSESEQALIDRSEARQSSAGVSIGSGWVGGDRGGGGGGDRGSVILTVHLDDGVGDLDLLELHGAALGSRGSLLRDEREFDLFQPAESGLWTGCRSAERTKYKRHGGVRPWSVDLGI